MKPRLKLTVASQLLLLTDGSSGLSQLQTRIFIKRHYGTLIAFAQRFGLPYQAVCDATRRHNASECGGRIADVRRLLGLPSTPSVNSIRYSQTPRKRTGLKPAPFLLMVDQAGEATA